MHKQRLIFEKTGRAKYISHLDLMRTFQRAFRRAGIELKHSEGFNPHPNLSIALPLPVGMESVCEILDFETLLPVGSESIVSLNGAMPEGIKITDIKAMGRKTGEIAWLDCLLTLIYDRGVPESALSAIEELFNAENITVLKKSKKGKIDFNIAPGVKSLKTEKKSDNEIVISAHAAAQNPSINPMLIADAVSKYLPEYAPDFATCLRLRMLDSELRVFE